MSNHDWGIRVLMVALCVAAGAASGVVAGDENRPTGSISQQCEKANAATEARFRVVAEKWRQRVADLRRPGRLKRVASDAAGFGEKLSQGISLFEGQSAPVDRMRQSLHRHVVNEKALAQEMAEAFQAYQKELIAESIALYGNTGIGQPAAKKFFQPVRLDTARIERAFDPVVARANALAAEDWFRFGLVNAGSSLVADGVEQSGRSAGFWNVEDGSIADFFAKLLTQIAVEVAIDHLTDPTDEFAKELQASMAAAERELLDGPSGLLTAMRRISTLHQQSRLQHHGLAVKGGQR